MINFIIALVLLLVSIAAVSIRKTYSYIPFKELKRRAERHDAEANRLYPTAAYGASLRALLWILIAVPAAAGFVLLSRIAPVGLSFVAVLLLIWMTFAWLPNNKVSRFSMRLTTLTAPQLLWILTYTHPVIGRVAMRVRRPNATAGHTGLYERADLLELIDQQRLQSDNRITEAELEVAWRALSLEDYRVSEVMTTLSDVRKIAAGDTIGPILIDELHKSGLTSVLVYEGEPHNIIGTLSIHTLGLHSTGTVRDHIQKRLTYLHEDDSLGEALHAFFATNQALFVILSPDKAAVGILTGDTLFQQLVGQAPSADIDHYADPSLIARRHRALPKKETQPDSGTEPGGQQEPEIPVEA